MLNYTYTEKAGDYGFSYQECKESYERFRDMGEKEFIKNLPGAIHLACFVCFFKEIPSSDCLSDKGIIHELIHLLHLKDWTKDKKNLKEVRNLFDEQLKLS